jgi:hypothetical protein
MHRGVIDHNAALGHHLLNMAQAQRVRRVPPHAHQHHLDRVVKPLEYLAQRLDHHLLRGFAHRLKLAAAPCCNRTVMRAISRSDCY